MTSLKGYHPDAKVEEGHYYQGKKTGVWKRYYPSGNLQNSVTYDHGRYKGEFISYFDNGNFQEKGTMKSGRLTGEYSKYYESGCVEQHKFVDKEGRVLVYEHFEDDCASPKAPYGSLNIEKTQIINGDLRVFHTTVNSGFHYSGKAKVLNKEGKVEFSGSLKEGKT